MIQQQSILKKIAVGAGATIGAFALLAGTWAFVQQPASAESDSTYSTLSLADPWTVVRGTPSGGYTATQSTLTTSVDNTTTVENASLQTEVLAKAIDDSSAIAATLKVDADWQNKPVRAGLWGEAFSLSDPGSGPSWPIIEFTTIGADDFTGFRVYDTRGGVSQKWYNLTDVSFTWGQSYALKIDYNPQTESYRFYVNNAQVLTLPASRSDNDDSTRSTFRTMMFTNYNSLTGNAADDYSATWTGAQYRLVADTPSVHNLVNTENAAPVQLETPAGTTLTESKTVAVDASAKDTGYAYPLGLVDFSFDTTELENTVSLVFVTDLTPAQVQVRKFNPTNKEYTEVKGAVVTETSLEGKHALRVTYTITDNGDLDLNPATGKITDPVGLATLPAVPNTGLQQVNVGAFIAAGVAGIALLSGAALVFAHARRR